MHMRAMLRGSRFIDPYARSLLIGYGLYLSAVALPELLGGLHGALDFAAGLLVCLAGFAPGVSLVGLLALATVVTAVFEPSVVSYDIPVAAAIAMLMSYGRVRSAVLGAFTFAGLALVTAVGPAGDLTWQGVLYMSADVILLGGLGLASHMAEGRIQFLIAKSAAEAVVAERERQKQRERFAIDAHDTVSHGLTAEYFMITSLLAEAEDPQQRERLAQLTLHNRGTQQRLRELLAGLGSTPMAVDRPLHEVLDATVEDIEATFYAAVRPLEIHTDIDRETGRTRIAPDLAADLNFFIIELATNILKHAGPAPFPELFIEARPGRLGLRTRNGLRAASAGAAEVKSLRARAGARGAELRARVDSGVLTIDLAVPLPQSENAVGTPLVVNG